ncbi:MAG: hypothetical protein ACREHV_04045 [Rhizomicrobium sp.]
MSLFRRSQIQRDFKKGCARYRCPRCKATGTWHPEGYAAVVELREHFDSAHS